MISAQNPLQLLNGNKAFWLVLLIFPLFMGCNALRKAQTSPVYEPNKDGTLEEIQGTRVYDPELGRWVIIEEAPKEKMDTIRWTTIPETRIPPITTVGIDVPSPLEPNGGGQQLNSYQIAVMLPFLTNRLNSDDTEINNSVSRWSVNFYAGMKIALDELEREGLSLEVTVMDTEANPALMDRMLANRADIRNAQLIIGPYRRDNIRLAANFAKEEGIVMVSPYSASDNLTQDNDHFIQVSPTLKTHCESLINHALNEFAPEDIILVTRDVDIEKQCLDMMQDAYYTKVGTRIPDTMPTAYIVPHQKAPYEELDLLPFTEAGRDLAFVVPSWADETFVYSFLRELDVARQPDQRIVVYGMPQWVNFQLIDYDYYERFHVRVSSTMFLDGNTAEVENFKRTYYERYGAIPDDVAFVGHDITLYFGRLMAEFGLNFQTMLENNAADMLHTTFSFEPVVDPGTTGMENRPIQRYENKHINILEFRNFQFSRLDR